MTSDAPVNEGNETERLQRLVEIWSKAVDTQMHFNEMSVKSRQLGLTFVAAALGVAIVLLTNQRDYNVPLGQWKIHVSVLICVGAIGAMWAVRKLDLKVYHRMLRGAVTFGEDFERQYMKGVFDLDKGMTEAISHFSRYDDADFEVSGTGRYTYTGCKRKSAEVKIRSFYRWVMTALCFMLIALLAVTNWATLSDVIGGKPFFETL